ncbi:tetratricopeptide repeat protein [Hyalangium gracile]|uniref:tetratricopeptide repeat protein n=1 Tax=Hyalangium gracile TaxID=394092 RepID=UPI001CCCC0AD|nr:tetratricopeptide repeat protein [Hyalangium gracile]
MLARLLRTDESPLFSRGAWDELPDAELPTPPLREGLGSAHLPVTTKVPLAQAYFDQGLRLLHMGWGAEARRAFAEASRQDPSLAMAWWGLALARGAGGRFAADRAEAIRKALALCEGATDLEQRYIVAASLLADKGPSNGRHAFVREMESLIDCHPEDPEARLLLAGFLMDGYEADGRPCAGQPYAQVLLRELLRTHPHHEGVHLAWVTSMLGSRRPKEALDSALRLLSLGARVSPYLVGAGRLLMRLGHTEQARTALQLAIEADDAWVAEQSLPVNAAPLAAEAMRLLVSVCAEAGQYREGQIWARRLRNRVEVAGDSQAMLLATCTLASLHLRFGFWRAAAELHAEPSADAPPAERGLLEGLRRYTRGLSALEAGRLVEAERACESLDAMHGPLNEERRAESHLLCPRDVARLVEVAADELRGALDARRGDPARAEATLIRAVRLERRLRAAGPAPFSRPARETLARVRMRFGREEKALELAEEFAAERPGSGHARFLVAEARVALGRLPEAVSDFTAFLECWREADPHLPELQRARAFMAGRGRHLRVVSSEMAVDEGPMLLRARKRVSG